MIHNPQQINEKCDAKPYMALYLRELDKKIYSVATCVDGQLASLLHPHDCFGRDERDVLVRSLPFLVTISYMRDLHTVLDSRTEKLDMGQDGVWDFWER